MTLWEHSNLLDQSRDKSDILGFSSTLVPSQQTFVMSQKCTFGEVEIVQHGARFKLVQHGIRKEKLFLELELNIIITYTLFEFITIKI